MANNIKFEVKNQLADLDLQRKTEVALSGLQQELINKKTDLLGKKTIEEATKFLQGLPILSDEKNGVLMLGDKYMKFDKGDPNKYQEALNEFKEEIEKANIEIESNNLFKEAQVNVVVNQTKEETGKLQNDVVVNTFLYAPSKDEIERNTLFQTFLRSGNDFERSLNEYTSSQVDAFKTTLLAAMQSARDKYQAVNGKQGEVKFTWNEWYTLQFVEAHKDQLKGRISDNTRNTLLREYRDGLKQDGTPKDLQGFENPNNSTKPTSVEQNSTDWKEVAKEEKKEGNKPETTPEVEKPTAVENLTPAQRDSEIKKTIAELIQNGWIKVEKVDGKAAPYAINLTQKQWQWFRKLYDLNYINTAIQEAQDGSLKISRIDKRINKLVDKAQRFAVEWKFDEATKATRKANELAQEKVRDSAEYAKLATDLANLTERYQRNVGLGSAGLAVAKQSKEFGYHGNTFAIDAYHPAFVNICKTLCVSEPQFGSIIDLWNGQQAVIDCPELRRYSNNQIDAGLRNFTPDAYNKCPSEYRQGWLEKLFLQTNMTPEQAKKNANLLTAWGIGVGLFFLGRWLFTGKWIDGKEHKAGWFFGRLWITAWSLLWINMLSQGFTGNNAMDIIKWLWYGDVKFEDLWNGKMGKERILGGRFDVANIALRDIPMVALAGCSVEAQWGGIKVNLSQLEAYLTTQLQDTKLSADRRGILEQQLEAIKSLKNDPQGEQKLQALFAEMGITYAYISDPKNSSLTLNDNFDTKSKNGQKLQEYLDKQWSKLAVPDSDPEVTAYLLFGKPTIDELAAKGKFTKLTEFEKAKDTQVVEPALLKVDQKYAPALQLALNKMSAIDFSKNNGARPGFSYENGILSLDSYGVKTPIWLDADNEYRVVWLDIPFPSAEEAVKTANLLNFIVVTYNWSATVEDPFNFIFWDIKKTDWLKTRRECFDKSKVASTIKNIFGTEVIDGDDYTLFPWTKSTIKDIGWSELAWNAGRTKLVQYLNGLKKKTDQTSIWKKWVDGQAWIVHTNEIDGWIDSTRMQFPKAEVDNSSATNTSSSAALESNGNAAAVTGVATGAGVVTQTVGWNGGNNTSGITNDSQNDVTHNWIEDEKLYWVSDNLRTMKNEERAKKLETNFADKIKDLQKLYSEAKSSSKTNKIEAVWLDGFFLAWANSIWKNDWNTNAYIEFEYEWSKYQRQPKHNIPKLIENFTDQTVKKGDTAKENDKKEAVTPASSVLNSAVDVQNKINIKDTTPYVKPINDYLRGKNINSYWITNWYLKVDKIPNNKNLWLYLIRSANSPNATRKLWEISPNEYATESSTINMGVIDSKVASLLTVDQNAIALTGILKNKSYSIADLFWNKPISTPKNNVIEIEKGKENVYLKSFFNQSNNDTILITNAIYKENKILELSIPALNNTPLVITLKEGAKNDENEIKKILAKQILKKIDKQMSTQTSWASASWW